MATREQRTAEWETVLERMAPSVCRASGCVAETVTIGAETVPASFKRAGNGLDWRRHIS
jgi:hypothetical protein